MADTISTIAMGREPHSSTRLTGRLLWIVRIIWCLAVLFAFALEAKHLTLIWAERTHLCTEPPCFGSLLWASDVPLLAELGITVEMHALYYILVDTVPSMLALIGIGLALAYVRSDDWMALATSLWLIGLADFKLPIVFAGPWGAAETILAAVILSGIILLMLIFPDGRFVPRWTRFLALPLVGWMIYIAYLPVDDPRVWPSWLTFFLIMAAAGGLLYRYFVISDEVQRRQLKWVIWAFPLRPIMELAVRQLIFPLIPIAFAPGLPRVFFHMITYPIVSTLPFILTAVALGVAMSRYRLWDIDFFINRALIYAMLTVGLGIAFGAAFFVARPLLVILLGGDQAVLAAVIATGLVVGLFGPVRSALRRFVDRRFYGIELDYVNAVKEYNRREEAAIRRQDERTRTSFADYTTMELLGRGGMGEVYRATHPTLNRSVAIKLLPAHLAADQAAAERFLREAQIIAGLKHPNIVTVYDFGEQDETAYIVMEYVDGQTLSEFLQDQHLLAPSVALPILQQLSSALDYAHEQGIIHRDIKPSNIMLERTTGTGQTFSYRVVLMDFGIARVEDMTRLTAAGALVGTLDYIAPEQIQGDTDIDRRADVYALGIMVFQLLTGELPYKHHNPGALVMAHLMEPPPDLRHILPDLPSQAAEAVDRALSKQPADRFASAGAFVNAFAVALT